MFEKQEEVVKYLENNYNYLLTKQNVEVFDVLNPNSFYNYNLGSTTSNYFISNVYDIDISNAMITLIKLLSSNVNEISTYLKITDKKEKIVSITKHLVKYYPNKLKEFSKIYKLVLFLYIMNNYEIRSILSIEKDGAVIDAYYKDVKFQKLNDFYNLNNIKIKDVSINDYCYLKHSTVIFKTDGFRVKGLYKDPPELLIKFIDDKYKGISQNFKTYINIYSDSDLYIELFKTNNIKLINTFYIFQNKYLIENNKKISYLKKDYNPFDLIKNFLNFLPTRS